MKYTLLDLVQIILSSMDSDEVDSIFDTTESTQVVNIVKTVYNDIVTRANLPEHYTLLSLTASGDNTKPTLMTLPVNMRNIKWVKYNKEDVDNTDLRFEEVYPLSIPEFLDRMHSLSESETHVGTFNQNISGSTITFLYTDNKAPEFYTSIDDNTIIFDSYDSAVDTTLQSAKTLVYGLSIPTFTASNTFTPDIAPEHFSLLLNEAKALAWAELKQTAHQKAEVNSRRGWVRQQKNKEAIRLKSDFNKLPSFGRK